MKQEKIDYKDIMSLGFTEEISSDNVYFNTYGFDYAIIVKDLTKKIYLDWTKETRLCEMIRIDHPDKCNIKSRMPIRDLEHLKEMIDFYSDVKSDNDIIGMVC